MGACVAGYPDGQVSGWVLARQRLFAELDAARHRHRLVWVWGVAGAGKTTLLASYAIARSAACVWCKLSETDRGHAHLVQRLARAGEQLARAQREPGSRQSEPDFGSSAWVLAAHRESELRAFARSFVESLCRELPAPRLVVFDDAHALPCRQSLADLLFALASAHASELSLLVASREPPPRELDRLVARGLLGAVDDAALRFTPKETSQLTRIRIGRGARAQTDDFVQGRTGGWAAAVSLTVDLLANETSRAAAERHPSLHGIGGCYDECVNRLLSSLPNAARDLVLKTSCLPWLTPSVVAEVAGAEALGTITELLVRGHLIALPGRECRYAYPSLLKSYLAREAEWVLPSNARTNLVRMAANRLLGDADPESALGLLRDAKDAQGLAEMAIREAPHLLARGLHAPLADWLEWASIELGVTTPWVALWLAQARLAFDPNAAIGPAEAAFRAFAPAQDRTGMQYAWATVVEALAESHQDLRLLDPWLARLEQVLAPGEVSPAAELEAYVASSAISGLSLRQPGTSTLARWVERGMALLTRPCSVTGLNKLGKALLCYHLWHGTPSRNDVLASTLRDLATSTQDAGLVALACHAEAIAARQRGHPERARAALRRSRSWSCGSGLGRASAWLRAEGVLCALIARDSAGAKAGLARLRATALDGATLGLCHYLESWLTLLSGELDTAQELAVIALTLADKHGDLTLEAMSRLALAELALERGCLDEARASLGSARSLGARLQSPVFDLAAAFVGAQLALEEQCPGSTEGPSGHGSAAVCLGSLLELAQRLGRYSLGPLPVRAEVAARLLDAALSVRGSEPIADRLVRANQLDDAAPSLDSLVWPWRIRVFTLGRFSVVVGGQPVRFSGKTQKRPLELLKALVAFGGREVCERRIADALWPDSEADSAERALGTTLHRLRALLRDERAVARRGRTLTLDARRVWVDVWALERGLSRASGLPAEQRREALDGLLRLYQQPFLAAESASWTTLVRERVRSRYLRAVAELSALHEEKNDIERATNVCLRGLDAEPLAEALYLRLMDLYARQGRPSEVRAVFRRCQASVASTCDSAPSADIVAAYRRLGSA
jgi:LuxR family transcriptional regulator, maltose regulon positive regulatory protein